MRLDQVSLSLSYRLFKARYSRRMAASGADAALVRITTPGRDPFPRKILRSVLALVRDFRGDADVPEPSVTTQYRPGRRDWRLRQAPLSSPRPAPPAPQARPLALTLFWDWKQNGGTCFPPGCSSPPPPAQCPQRPPGCPARFSVPFRCRCCSDGKAALGFQRNLLRPFLRVQDGADFVPPVCDEQCVHYSISFPSPSKGIKRCMPLSCSASEARSA